MTRTSILTAAVGAWLSTASSVLALGGDHPPETKIAQDYNKEWPHGLPDLINSADRVGGHWVNANDIFYYVGDPADLNAYLAAYAKLPNTPLTVVLHAGGKPLTGKLGGPKNIPYAWHLDIARRGWGVPVDPQRPKEEPGYVVTVHVWLNDVITLDQLDVSKKVEVRSAGDIENFIKARQKPAK